MIQVDRFPDRVRWSLRDPKTMQEYGFPTHSKTNEHYIMTLRLNPHLMKTLVQGTKERESREHLKKIKTQMTSNPKRKGFIVD